MARATEVTSRTSEGESYHPKCLKKAITFKQLFVEFIIIDIEVGIVSRRT